MRLYVCTQILHPVPTCLWTSELCQQTKHLNKKLASSSSEFRDCKQAVENVCCNGGIQQLLIKKDTSFPVFELGWTDGLSCYIITDTSNASILALT